MEDLIKKILARSPEAVSEQLPKKGHEARFLEKLQAQKTSLKKEDRIGNSRSLSLVWKKNTVKFLSIAASVALLFGAFQWGAYTRSNAAQISAIAPDAVKLSAQYAGPIAKAISHINTEVTPLTKPHIDRALEKISGLEENFNALEKALLSGGNTRLILQAMILNYQTRIELLEEVTNQIETINSINNNRYENM